MKNQITWKRESNNQAVPYLFERVNNHWMWRRYNASSIYVPDNPNFSKGYLTFLKALKLGYEVLYDTP